MKQRKIMLKTIEDAKKFVNASIKCDFDIDVFYNRVVIDAKSILGVMSLDLTQILTVEYMGEDAEYEAFLDTMEANQCDSGIKGLEGWFKRNIDIIDILEGYVWPESA